MSKAKQSKKRVVLRRAAKRRTRYEGAVAGLVSSEGPAYLRAQPAGDESRPAWLRMQEDAEEGDLAEIPA